MPEEFVRLVNDYHPDNLNLMNHIDLFKLIHISRLMTEALELVTKDLANCDNHGIEEARIALSKMKEWKL